MNIDGPGDGNSRSLEGILERHTQAITRQVEVTASYIVAVEKTNNLLAELGNQMRVQNFQMLQKLDVLAIDRHVLEDSLGGIAELIGSLQANIESAMEDDSREINRRNWLIRFWLPLLVALMTVLGGIIGSWVQSQQSHQGY